ncbi:MAG TPA: hydantoinase B/oxoprolinase family protein [bacterium]|nr:hydantoinase B/oxoprolinase family protein [bacterium]
MSEPNIGTATLGILRAAIPAICDEMAVVLQRTAYNMFIYEVQDYSVAIVDPEGNLIAQNRGAIPLFLADLGPPIRSGLEEIGRDNLFPGDVILMNHPAVCGQHLNNVIVYQPMFFEGRLVGFAVARGHWMDIGGSKVGIGFSRTLDVYQEGLQFRNLKIYEAGKPNKTLFQIVQDNLRRPDLALGDLRAQIAACRLGEKRFLELLQKHGFDTVLRAVQIIADQSEERARKAVAQIPDGVYEAESFLDNDGVDLDKTIPVKVRVIVEGTEMTFDYTEMSEQVQGPINSGSGGLVTARSAFKILTSPADSANEGHFRPVKLILPPGKLISAKPPAAMGSWSMGLSTVLDTILKALAPAIPHLIPAGHKADQGSFGFYGIDPATGKYWFCGNIRGGGWGGRPHEDGESASVNIMQGDITTAPVEVLEQKFPLFVESHILIQDSGGAGKFRGGLGTEWRIRPFGVDHVFINIGSERFKCPPWGLWGGKPAMPNHYLVDLGDGREPEVITKRPGVRVPKEGWVGLRSGGGGGWGDPLERETERVLTDVLRGYVSSESAYSDYGVVLDRSRKKVDEAATRALREKMRRARGGVP